MSPKTRRDLRRHAREELRAWIVVLVLLVLIAALTGCLG